MAAGSIVIDLLMRTGAFETDTKRAEKALANFNKKAKEVGKAVGLAIVGAGTAVALMTRSVIEAAHNIERLSALANTSSDTFQRWSAGASMVGIEQQKLADILKDTQDKIGDFIQTGGGAMADFFENIAPKVGVTAEQFRKLSGPQALQLYVKSLEKANLSQSDMIFYMEAIASDSSLLLPLLRDNAAGMEEYGDMAERLGAVMSGEMLSASKLAKEELNKLDLVKKGLVNRIVQAVLPSLTNMTSKLVETAEKTSALDKVARIAVTGMKLLTSAGIIVAGIFKTVGEALGGVGAAVVAIFQGEFARAWDITKSFSSDVVGNIKGTISAVDAVWSSTEIKGTPIADAAQRDVRLAQGFVKDGGKKIVSEAEKVYKQIEQAIAKISEDVLTFGMTDEQKILFSLEVDGATDEQLGRARTLLDTLRRLRGEEEKRKELLEKSEQGKEVLNALNLEIEALGKSAEWIAKRNALLDAGVTAESDMGKAILETVDNLYRQGEAIDAQIDLMDTFRQGASNALADVIRGAKSAKDAFIDFLDSVLDRITQMIAERWIEQLFGQMGTTDTGSSGGWISSLFGSLFGGAKAGGGDVLGGRPILIGEQGPEMFIPRTAGTIIPAQQTSMAMAGGRGSTYNNTNIFNRPVTPATASQLALETAIKTRTATSRNG